MPNNNDHGIEHDVDNKKTFHQKLKESRINLTLTSPKAIIRIKRKIVWENYEIYGPTNTRYELEKKKENSIFSFDKY
ncbi:MAG: hypothetical protein HYR87_08505 [Thaumarchaeota archaeon]|nr:hypothetical protein [Nitrososphaerota archaeon]